MFVSELDSFVLKLKQLWQAGQVAHLDVDANAGKAWVGLRVQLGQPPCDPPFCKSKNTPSRQRRRARRAAAREVEPQEMTEKATVEETAANENPVDVKETTDHSTKDVAVQAAIPTPIAVDAAVQAVEETVDGAAQAYPPPHQESRPSQGVPLLAEQAGQPPRADLPLHHRLDDLMCRDAEYLPALLGQLSDREQYRVDREREREKDLLNFTKMLEDSLHK